MFLRNRLCYMRKPNVSKNKGITPHLQRHSSEEQSICSLSFYNETPSSLHVGRNVSGCMYPSGKQNNYMPNVFGIQKLQATIVIRHQLKVLWFFWRYSATQYASSLVSLLSGISICFSLWYFSASKSLKRRPLSVHLVIAQIYSLPSIERRETTSGLYFSFLKSPASR